VRKIALQDITTDTALTWILRTVALTSIQDCVRKIAADTVRGSSTF
jgi:hypothetical protein